MITAVSRAVGRMFVPLLAVALVLSVDIAQAQTIYIEDFESDTDPGLPGFASSIFQHNINGPNWFFFPGAPPVPPSPDHALFMGAITQDFSTFDLPPNQYVDYAGVWMTGTGGGDAGVTFLGANGINAAFVTSTQDLYEWYDTTGSGIDQVIGIILGSPLGPFSGHEALYDNVTIRVVPEPSSLLLTVVAFAGLGLVVSRRRR